jgi:hypothetical protein
MEDQSQISFPYLMHNHTYSKAQIAEKDFAYKLH